MPELHTDVAEHDAQQSRRRAGDRRGPQLTPDDGVSKNLAAASSTPPLQTARWFLATCMARRALPALARGLPRFRRPVITKPLCLIPQGSSGPLRPLAGESPCCVMRL